MRDFLPGSHKTPNRINLWTLSSNDTIFRKSIACFYVYSHIQWFIPGSDMVSDDGIHLHTTVTVRFCRFQTSDAVAGRTVDDISAILSDTFSCVKLEERRGKICQDWDEQSAWGTTRLRFRQLGFHRKISLASST
jgi:hypothetical protein